MNSTVKIFCKNLNRYLEVEGGSSLIDIYNSVKEEIQIYPICARVNNKNEGLGYVIYGPKQVEFLDRYSPSGTRVYVRSLCMVLYKAVKNLYPSLRLRMQHSVSRGYFCTLSGDNFTITPEVVKAIKDEMQLIIDTNIPFRRHEKLTTDVIELFRNQGLNDKVNLLETSKNLYTTYYTLGETADSYYSALAPSTGVLKDFDLQPYQHGMLLLAFNADTKSGAQTPIEQKKMFDAFTTYTSFNKIIGVDDVGALNKVVLNKEVSMLINVVEALHFKVFSDIAAEIVRRNRDRGAKIVLVSGPSSSGKTTSTKRLAIQLMTNLVTPKMISLDNYFVNRVNTPLDENGDYDYESLYALDLQQFNADLEALLRGEEVALPTYNFELGERQYKGNTLRLDESDVLIIEGIHGLNPELTANIPDNQKFKIYVSALTTLTIDDHNWVPTSDNRLLRRIIRDYKYRGVSATETIRRWASVRAGEEKWIFPYQEYADATVNSSLLFELGVMKDYVEPVLRSVPHNVPEYAEAIRLRTFLDYFVPISEHQVPSTSLLREFLGGSSFHY
ncbi:MAG: nucleoside kinase [Muribaculaceae bacterium]|nr:nucleoside kinase [Muribaculaceae bacterium]